MNMLNKSIITTLAAIMLSAATTGQGVASELTGSLALESRWFIQPPQYTEQSRHNQSATLNLDWYQDYFDGDARLSFDAIIRQDSDDNARNLADIQELVWWQAFDQFNLSVGSRKVFWGVTETRHLVDVINQTDNLANLDGEDKLGQPMLTVQFERDWGTLEAFALLGFRSQQFAGQPGRLRGPFTAGDINESFQSSGKQDRVDLAIRYSHVLGDVDLGLSYFDGTDRQPILSTTMANEQPKLQVHYQLIKQIGLDLQATKDSWLWKLEAIGGQIKQGGGYSAAVVGFEKTRYGVFDTAADVGWLVEYLFDDRDDQLQNNDIAIGARIALNNTQSSEFLLAMSVDIDNKSRFVSAELAHRLSDNWSVEAQARFFAQVDELDPSYALRDDDYLQLSFSFYF